MNHKKIVLIALGCCIVIGLQFNQQNTFAYAQKTAPGGLPQKFQKIFVGKIGGKYAIRMGLTRSGKTLTGTYYYDTVHDDIDLAGTIDSGGQFKLTETDSQNVKTGTFNGKMVISGLDGQNSIALSGSWQKTGAGAALGFDLSELKFDIGLGGKLETKKLSQNVKKQNYAISIEYPQVTGIVSPGQEKFNKFISSLITKESTDFKKEVGDAELSPTDSMGSSLDISYDIDLATSDLIVVSFSVGNYYAGAAHPNSNYITVNYDVSAGKELKLKDLFKPNSQYLGAISRYCTTRLKKKLGPDGADTISEGASPKADNYSKWCITDGGLLILFDSYQVAAYAEGPQQVLIPYSKLADLIEPLGPVGKYAK